MQQKFNVDNYEDAKLLFTSKLRCSALVKAVKDDSGNVKDVLIGHATWDDYNSLTRIYKHYKFDSHGLNNDKIELTFSSYPGNTLFYND